MADYIPDKSNLYEGSQILFNSGRLILNAKTDSIFITANKAVSIASNGTLNFDSKSYSIFNSPKIYLGLDAHKEEQPLLLGQNTYKLLSKLLSSIDTLATDLLNVISTPTGTNLIQLSVAGNKLKTKVSTLKTDLEKIKSKQNFTV
jgi:hypothetical protein